MRSYKLGGVRDKLTKIRWLSLVCAYKLGGVRCKLIVFQTSMAAGALFCNYKVSACLASPDKSQKLMQVALINTCMWLLVLYFKCENGE